MEEEWRYFTGDFEGLYMVSNLGRVKSMPRKYVKKERILKIQKFRGGYLYVNLKHLKKSKNKSVHRLVANAFLGESTLDVNHIDGCKTNNNISNLEYVTESQNTQHAMKNGFLNISGENCHKSKLSKNQVYMIYFLLKYTNLKKIKIAKHYDVTLTCLYCIYNKRSWKHLKLI